MVHRLSIEPSIQVERRLRSKTASASWICLRTLLLAFLATLSTLSYIHLLNHLQNHESLRASSMVKYEPDNLRLQSLKSTNFEGDSLARIVMGIMTADFADEAKSRPLIRQLFKLDKKICALGEWRKLSQEKREHCHLVYTFVVGGNPKAGKELVDEAIRPFLVPSSEIPKAVNAPPNDLDQDDVLFLNIQ